MPQRSKQSRAAPPISYPKKHAPNRNLAPPRGATSYPPSHGQHPQHAAPQASNMAPQYMNHTPDTSYPQNGQYPQPQYYPVQHQQMQPPFSQYPPQHQPHYEEEPPPKPKKIAIADAIGLLSIRLGKLENIINEMNEPDETQHTQQSINTNLVQKIEALEAELNKLAIEPSRSLSNDATEQVPSPPPTIMPEVSDDVHST
jgi:hypothetical protein